MKKRLLPFLLSLLCCMTTTLSVVAQNEVEFDENSNALFIFQKDSTTLGVSEQRDEEWCIEFSNKDSLNQLHSFPVALKLKNQNNTDTLNVQLQKVDSILCQTPVTVYSEGVYRITEQHFPYILTSDSVSTITFDARCQQYFDLPKVGQKVLCEIFTDPLPYGFIGRVETIKNDNSQQRVTIVCEKIELKEVYDCFYHIGNGVEKENNSPQLIQTKDSKFELDIIPPVTYKEKLEAADMFSMEIGITPRVTLTITTVVDKEKNKDELSCILDSHINVSSNMKFDCAIASNADKPWEKELFKRDNIPTSVPGLLINVKGGIYCQYALSGNTSLEASVQLGRRFGFEKSNDDWTIVTEHNSKEPNFIYGKLEGNKNYKLEGGIEFGPYLTLEGSIVKVVDLSIEPKIALEAKSEISWAPIKMECKEGENIEDTKTKYIEDAYEIASEQGGSEINLKIDATVKPKFLNGKVIESLTKYLEFNFQKSFTLKKMFWAPKVKLTTFNNSIFGFQGNLNWTQCLHANSPVSLKMTDISKKSDLEETPAKERIVNIDLGLLDGGLFGKDEQDKKFHIKYEDDPYLWYGKIWEMRPIVEAPILRTLCPGLLKTFYTAYAIGAPVIKQDHYNVYIQGKITEWLYNDQTQDISLIFISTDPKLNGETIPLDKAGLKANGGWFEIPYPQQKLPRGKHEVYLKAVSQTEKMDGKPCVSQSSTTEIKPMHAYEPTTGKAKVIDYTTVEFTGVMLEGIGDILMKEGINNFYVGFEYSLGALSGGNCKTLKRGVSAAEFTNQQNGFLAVVTDLIPDASYQYRAFTQIDGIKYYAQNVVTVTTSSIFGAFEIDPSADDATVNIEFSRHIKKSKDAVMTIQIAEDKYLETPIHSLTKSIPSSEWIGDADVDNWMVEDVFQTLVPNTTYYIQATLKVQGKVYKSDIKKFETLNTIQNLKLTPHANYVECQVTAIKQSNIPIYATVYFEFAEDEAFKHPVDKATTVSKYMSWEHDKEGNWIIKGTTAKVFFPQKKYYGRASLVYDDVEVQTKVMEFSTIDPYSQKLEEIKTLGKMATVVGHIEKGAIVDIANGNLLAEVFMEFSTSPDFKSEATISTQISNEVLKGGSPFTLFEEMPEYKTTYYARMTINDGNLNHSNVVKFKTGNAIESTISPVKVEGNKAHFSAELSEHTYNMVRKADLNTKVYFEYAQNAKFDHALTLYTDLEKGRKLTSTAIGLDYNTKYYVRLVILMDNDFTTSDAESFRTPNPFGCETLDAVIDDATVTMKGALSADAIEMFNADVTNTVYAAFDFATSEADLEVEGKFERMAADEVDLKTGAFHASAVLEPNTTYYFRALIYGENKAHPSKVIKSFKTLDYDPDLVPLSKKKKVKQ